MGRQFAYFCLPEDLAEIEEKVFVPAGGTLLVVEKRNERHYIVPIGNFPLARELMGTQSLSLLLAPPEPLRSLVFSGPWLDVANSNVITVDRCYLKDGGIRSGRFWYEPKVFKDGTFHEKPKEFVAWAQAIFNQTKKLLSRQSFSHGNHTLTEWFGRQAWREVKEGRLVVALN
ncbi:hypothetical protein GCM10025771_13650 [Niveibacterium umoris]|uniref:Uncharacterized protein n=1 Tax=Niveibacterium umoris TaxID=1193620 RepID=A0A840BQH7_9RHOO|nr:hypothetical protein [Niveibacterium umoris]MBB4014944.1 hypothetical protein [Niveibacterium umoris]